MKAFLQLTVALALLLVAASAAVLSIDGHQTLRALRVMLADADTSIKTQNLNLAADEQKLNATLDVVNAAASEQRDYWRKTSADSDKTVKALRIAVDRASLLMKHTDEQLNASLIPDADRQLNLTAESAQGAFGSLGQASDAVAFQVQELDLGPALANLDESSARLANTMAYLQSASGHADNILLDGERVADHYEKEIMKPVSLGRRIGEYVLTFGADARVLFTGGH